MRRRRVHTQVESERRKRSSDELSVILQEQHVITVVSVGIIDRPAVALVVREDDIAMQTTSLSLCRSSYVKVTRVLNVSIFRCAHLASHVPMVVNAEQSMTPCGEVLTTCASVRTG